MPGAFFAVLFLLPFFDRNPERRLAKRPVARAAGSVVVAALVFLTAWGAYESSRSAGQASEKVTVEGEIGDTFVVSPEIGRQLFRELKCAGCHESESSGANIPPGLEFSGNKYRQPWLARYLQSPHRVRWRSKGKRPVARMPNFDLSTREALNLASYLMTLRRDEKFPKPEFNWTEADSDMVASGEELLFEYGCKGCHRVGEEGQEIGPDLSQIGNKLTETYLFDIIQAPEKVIPGTKMKNMQLETEDIEDVVAYLRFPQPRPER